MIIRETVHFFQCTVFIFVPLFLAYISYANTRINMSKSFLTIAQAYTKLGLSGGGNNWIRKSELVATGKCDVSLLEKYGDNDYVVDDDIVKKSSSIIYEIYDKSFYGKTTDRLLKPFNPSKPFKIRCAVTFNNLNDRNLNTAFIIVNGNVNLTCCKANLNSSSYVSKTSYWFSADDLGEHHYGYPQNGFIFEYIFSYNGDNKDPISEANLPLKLEQTNTIYKPRNLESDTIYFCYDPRNSEKTIDNIHFDYLIIEQE